MKKHRALKELENLRAYIIENYTGAEQEQLLSKVKELGEVVSNGK
jgi:hypothetical protein